jgi:hypothetical protein
MTVTKARELVASRKPQPEAKLEPEREPAVASPGLKAS